MTPDPALVFLAFATGGTLAVGAAVRTALRTRRRSRGDTTRTRTRASARMRNAGGRSSRPTRNRVVRCAVYIIPSFTEDRIAYIGISTKPWLRIPQHMVKWWWMYTKPGITVIGKRVIGVEIIWYKSEDAAYEEEQRLIGKHQPWFNVEGNYGRGITGPTDSRVINLQRQFLAAQRKRAAA